MDYSLPPPPQLILLGLFTQKHLEKIANRYAVSLVLIAFSFLGPDILPSTLFSNTTNLCSVPMTDQGAGFNLVITVLKKI
jgi:hypothetical protein